MTDRLIEACKKLAEAEPGKWAWSERMLSNRRTHTPYHYDGITSDEVDEIAAELGMEVEVTGGRTDKKWQALVRVTGERPRTSTAFFAYITKREARIEGLIKAIEIYCERKKP